MEAFVPFSFRDVINTFVFFYIYQCSWCDLSSTNYHYPDQQTHHNATWLCSRT